MPYSVGWPGASIVRTARARIRVATVMGTSTEFSPRSTTATMVHSPLRERFVPCASYVPAAVRPRVSTDWPMSGRSGLANRSVTRSAAIGRPVS